MQQTEILHKRNLLIFYSLLVHLAIHMITIAIGLFTYRFHYPIFAICLAIFLGCLFYYKTNPRITQFSLIAGWNVFIVFLAFQSEYIISIYWFLFFILLISIYRQLIINIVLSIITCIEAAIIVSIAQTSYNFGSGKATTIYIFFLLLVCFIGIIQTIYVKRLWKNLEKETFDREQKLASTKAYLQLFFEHAEDSIAVLDLDNKIIEINPAFERMYGWTKEECVGKFLPLVPPHNFEAAQQRVEKLLQGDSINLIETQDMRKDGTYFDVQISLSPIYNQHGDMIAVSFISRDISYIKDNEKLIMQSEKLKLAGEIAAGVAHEIRNPMTVISGFIQMMSEDTSSPYHEYTKIIQNEIERIDLIMSEFLVLSRPQVETFMLINIGEILAELSQFFHYEFQLRNIKLIIQSEHANSQINGNENQIKQVFINIIKNAIEAIGESGTITLDLSKDDNGCLQIAITDTGCGIPPHLLERIFEPFYTTKTKGTGLGMMIINKIIREHGGAIKIRSKQKVGTEILIRLPVVE